MDRVQDPNPTDQIVFDGATNDVIVKGPNGIAVRLKNLLANKMSDTATIDVGGCNAAGDNGDQPNITQAISSAVPGAIVRGSPDAVRQDGVDWVHWWQTGNWYSGNWASLNTDMRARHPKTYIDGQLQP